MRHLEWVMESKIFDHCSDPTEVTQWVGKELTLEQKSAIRQYQKFHDSMNKHKMESYSYIHTMKIGVIGAGRLGICFALLCERAGYDVLVSDIREDYVNDLNQQEDHYQRTGGRGSSSCVLRTLEQLQTTKR